MKRKSRNLQIRFIKKAVDKSFVIDSEKTCRILLTGCVIIIKPSASRHLSFNMETIEKRLIAGIFAVSVLLILTGIVSYNTLMNSIKTAGQLSHTHEVVTEIEATLSTLKDAETGQRGYLIAGRETYLEPFNQANEHIQEHLSRLENLTADNRQHRESLAAIAPMVDARFALLRRAIGLRQSEGFEAAQKQILTGEGKEKMDALREGFGKMEEVEKAILQERLTASETYTRNVIINFAGLFTLIISLFCLIFIFVKRDITVRNRLETKLREMATIDELTGIYNRREMNRLLKLETRRFKRYGNHLSFLLLDIDHFKSVNDIYGHQIGDEVLKWIAAILRESFRTVDITARYGGEEFAIVLPETKSHEAFIIAERVRQKIAEKSFPFRQGDGQSLEIPITVSVGVAGMTGSYSETTFIESADKALYRAKAEGRNRVFLADASVSQTESILFQAVA